MEMFLWKWVKAVFFFFFDTDSQLVYFHIDVWSLLRKKGVKRKGNLKKTRCTITFKDSVQQTLDW